MGQHVLVAIALDSAWSIERDDLFGESLMNVIQKRGNPNIPSRPPGVHGTELGPQFHSNDTFLVFIEDGAITRLSIEEQNHLRDCLAQFRKEKPKHKK